MAKNRQQKKKEREQRVAKQKLAEAARRREIARKNEADGGKQPRAKKVITAGVKQQVQAQGQVSSQKPIVTHRRAGG